MVFYEKCKGHSLLRFGLLQWDLFIPVKKVLHGKDDLTVPGPFLLHFV